MSYRLRARYIAKKRMAVIVTAFVLFTSLLLLNLFKLQCLQNTYYQNKVYEQITTSTKLRAKRGNIYDSHMNLLACEKTTWRIFVMAQDVKKRTKTTGTDYARVIAEGLATILELDYPFLYNKIKDSAVIDLTVASTVPEETYEKVLAFIRESHLESLVQTEAQSSRYYPNGTAFAHVLGFTGSDLQGLYGLEYQYDEELSGKDGSYLYAKDAGGNVLPTEYESFFPPENGYSLITTLDSYVQSVLEEEIEMIRVNHEVNNRVCGIVMNTADGSVLAMATTSPFNPNDPYTLDEVFEEKLIEAGYEEGSDEYRKYKKELLEIMWSNKAVSETYEPGSTFKIITVSTALALKVATMQDRFSCIGYYEVGGWHIKCHKIGGHGSNFTLAYGLQMSCNPTMMNLAERIGAANYYSYVEKFGYFQKSGIDLPSEARTIFHKLENIGATELATMSFGQRFKVSILDNFRPDIVIGSGGYVCFPVIFKAQTKHIKTVLHESNAIPGLAIRLLSKKADRVFYSFPGTEDYFCDKTNLVLTGMPVRSAFCELTKEDARSALHIKPDDFLIVSFGGSLGSKKMNEAILSILFEEKTKPHLRHIHGCGSHYFEELKKKAPSLCQRNAKVKIVPYIKDMPKWMKSADLVISRSGASTIAEIATAGVPAIFIPSPNVTGNHQYENAKRLKDKKAAILIEEKDLTPEILQKEIDKMQKEKEISKLLTTNLSCFSMKNASKKMVTEIEELIKTP